MLSVKKRDGAIQQFDAKKIEAAIEKAFAAEHKFSNPDIIEMNSVKRLETISLISKIYKMPWKWF